MPRVILLNFKTRCLTVNDTLILFHRFYYRNGLLIFFSPSRHCRPTQPPNTLDEEVRDGEREVTTFSSFDVSAIPRLMSAWQEMYIFVYCADRLPSRRFLASAR